MSGLRCQLKICGKAASSCVHRANLQERFIEMKNGVNSGLRKKCLLGKAGVFKWASYCFSISHNPYYIIVSWFQQKRHISSVFYRHIFPRLGLTGWISHLWLARCIVCVWFSFIGELDWLGWIGTHSSKLYLSTPPEQQRVISPILKHYILLLRRQ